MSDNYQIVFLSAGDGSAATNQAVATKIATASKSSVEKLLSQIEAAPFVYKRGLPKDKAEKISAALNKLGAVTEVTADGAEIKKSAAPAAKSGGGDFSFGGGGGFDFGAPAKSATPNLAKSPAESGGFGFGAPETSPSGGFDFGAPTPVAAGGATKPTSGGSKAGSGPSGFDFGSSSKGSGNDEFGMEDPKASGDGGGFNFSMDAAVSTPSTIAGGGSAVAVERNEDFTSSAPVTKRAAPPVAAGKTVVCPRCNAEVPDKPECGSCGVLMAKAGPDTAAPSPQRTKGRAKVKKRSPVIPILGVAAALVLGLAVAFITGALNPMRLKFDAGRNVTLQEYGVTLTPPSGPLVDAVVTDPAHGKAIDEGFAGASVAIEKRIDELSTLDDVAAFDQAAEELAPTVTAYVAHPANDLRKAVLNVIAPYYPAKGVAIRVGDKSYIYRDELELASPALKESAQTVLSDVGIRLRLEAARKAVGEAEQRRQTQALAARTDIDFLDSFDGGLNDRWLGREQVAVQFSQGWLSLTASPNDAANAPRLLLEEPGVDYSVELSVSGASDGAVAGIVVMSQDQRFITWGRGADRGTQQVQLNSQAGVGLKAKSGRDVRLRIVRRGDEYFFSFAGLSDGKFTEVDKFRPFDAGVPRWLGITAFGGKAAFFVDDFNVTISR